MVERILVVGPKDTLSMVDDLAPKGFEIVKALHNSPEQKAGYAGAHYFVGFVQQYVNEQLYKDAPHLKLIQLLSAGYDKADLKAMNKHKVPMCNNGGANSVAVSEHALLLMLSVSRRLITQHTNVTAGRWHGNSPPTVHQVREKVLGIIGLGTMARRWPASPRRSACTCTTTTSPGSRRSRRTRSACASACCRRSCAIPTSSRCTCR